MLIKQNNRKK